MRRREFLAVVSAAAATGFAGCPAATGGDTPERTQPSDAGETPTPSRTPDTVESTPTPETKPESTTNGNVERDRTLAMGETFRTGDGRELTVSDPAVHRLVLAPERVSHHLYHRVTAAPANRQYLTFAVRQAGFDVTTSEYPGIGPDGWPASLSLAVAVFGEHYTSGRTVVGTDSGSIVGRVGIPVPLVDAPTASVVWERSDGPAPTWELPDDVGTDLSSTPEFEVGSLDVPDEVTRGDLLPMTVTVANTGDRDGRFLAEFDVRRGVLDLDETSMTISAGETVTHTVTRLPEYVEGTDPLPVVLDWGSDRREATVEVRDRPTDTRSE